MSYRQVKISFHLVIISSHHDVISYHHNVTILTFVLDMSQTISMSQFFSISKSCTLRVPFICLSFCLFVCLSVCLSFLCVSAISVHINTDAWNNTWNTTRNIMMFYHEVCVYFLLVLGRGGGGEVRRGEAGVRRGEARGGEGRGTQITT